MATTAQAKTRLARMVSHDIFPEISTEELDDLLSIAALPDLTGLAPSDANWTPRYDLTRAAAEGWKWKMARLSDMANVRTGDLTHVDSVLFQNAERMLKMYQRGVNGSAVIRNSGYSGVGDPTVVFEDEDEEA